MKWKGEIGTIYKNKIELEKNMANGLYLKNSAFRN